MEFNFRSYLSALTPLPAIPVLCFPICAILPENFKVKLWLSSASASTNDEQKWKEFVAKNEMIWPQCRDGGFTGSISKSFYVTAIPHTFTIYADGVLQDEHIGDASIEGKPKKTLSPSPRTTTPKALPLTAPAVRESVPASAIFAITNTPRSQMSAQVHSRRRKLHTNPTK